MKLTTKIIILIFSICFPVISALSYVLYALTNQESSVVRVFQNVTLQTNLSNQLIGQQDSIYTSMLSYRYTKDMGKLQDLTQAQVKKTQIIYQIFATIKNDQSKELALKYLKSQSEMDKSGTELVSAIQKNDTNAVTQTTSKWEVLSASTRDRLADLNTYNINSLSTTLTAIQGIRTAITTIVLAILIGVLLLGIFGYLFLQRIIIYPVKKMFIFANGITKGNFNEAIKYASKDEIGNLASALTLMAKQLKSSYEGLENKILFRTQELNESEHKLNAILASVGDGLVAVDEQGKVMLINTSALQLLGRKRDSLLGKVWVDQVVLQDGKDNRIIVEQRPFTLALEKMELITSSNYVYVRADGSRLPIVLTVSPIVVDGKKLGAIEVFHDITKEKDIDRMKTEFISLASHQLRTPLSAMKWFLEMLIDGDAGTLTTEQKEFVNTIYQSNERMIALVNSLLNVSRIESGRIIINPKPTDVRELLSVVRKDIENELQIRKQTLVMSVSDDVPKMNLDQQLVRQVYMNLLTNAIKYTPKGGKIIVSVEKKDQEVVSQITDTGYGIAHSDKDKVFQKFYRGENAVKVDPEGNGLGMYLVKAILDSSQGRIWFESKEGEGTTFWFTLPLAGMIMKKGEVALDN